MNWLVVQQNVLLLDVVVRLSEALVQVLRTEKNLPDHGCRPALCGGLDIPGCGEKVAALAVFHDNVRHSAIHERIKHPHEVGMLLVLGLHIIIQILLIEGSFDHEGTLRRPLRDLVDPPLLAFV